MSALTTIPVPGDLIEDYEILEKIGGNMGLVFKSRHRLLNKMVALKLLPAEWMADSKRLERFEREIRVLGQLEHPNLVTAADARRVEPWFFVAMEWIEGVDLQQLVKAHGALPVNAACEAARQSALGLQYAHEHNLVHRDIKPSNLMLTDGGTIKVIDMGLALISGDNSPQLTQTGNVMGTLSYCAPEQFRDSSGVDTRADIYSLGCTLYHLLTGQPPYGRRKSLTEIIEAHLNEPFPRLCATRPDAPVALEALLVRMTQKDPAERFATPGEVAAALEPFARGADLKPLVPAKADQPRPVPVDGGKPARKPQVWPAAKAQSQPLWPRFAAIAALVLAVATVVFLAARPAGNDPVPVVNASAPVVNAFSPVIFLMDTTAPRGIYDEDNTRNGRSNADELYLRLAGMDSMVTSEHLYKEAIGLDWVRETFVAARKPDIVIIHRSSFFHPIAARLNLKYPPKTEEERKQWTEEDQKQWQEIYDGADARLRSFIRIVGGYVPHTQFLIYSRGTDTNWLNGEFRTNWVATLEESSSSLNGRINTMVIPEQPNGKGGTFRDPATMAIFRERVREMFIKLKARKPDATK